MPSGVVSTVLAYKAALAKREALQMLEMASYWQTIQDALSRDMLDFAKSVEGQTLTEWQVFRMQRYKDLLRQVDNQLNWYGNYAEGVIGRGRMELAHLGVQHASNLIRISYLQSRLPQLSFNILPVSQIENIAGSVPLRTLLRGTYGDAKDAMLKELLSSVARGSNPVVTARNMAKGTGKALNSMLRIARTEQLRSYREASRQEYIESGVVDNYKRIAARQMRTCLACLIADGTEYDLGTEFEEHVCGRCSLVPNVKGCPKATWLTGKEWLSRQSEADQRAKLGNRSLDDLRVSSVSNPVWGNSIEVH